MTQPHVRGSCYFVVLDCISSLSQRGEFHPLWDLPLCERGSIVQEYTITFRENENSYIRYMHGVFSRREGRACAWSDSDYFYSFCS